MNFGISQTSSSNNIRGNLRNDDNGHEIVRNTQDCVGTLPTSEIVDQLISDLLDLCADQISNLLILTDASSHHSILLDLVEYQFWNPKLSHLILFYPQQMFPLLDEALLKAQVIHRNKLSQRQSCIKPNCHVRLYNKFEAHEIISALVPRSESVGKLIFFKGTVIRTGMMKMLETSRTYLCTTCQKQFSVPYEVEQYNAIPKPTRCLATRRATAKPCKGTRFEEASAHSENTEPLSANCKDYQEIKVQEQTTRMDIGSIPRSITVILHDDLVDLCKAGDDIFVTGVVIRRWRSVSTSYRCDVELVILANNVHVHSQQKGGIILDDSIKEQFQQFWTENRHLGLTPRDAILKNVCPDIVGMYWVKLAVMLILVGGVSKYQDGLKMRGDGHMLLVGDPGTGKSQFLKYASRLVPRTVYTTGIGSTNAGLTVTAVKDSGEWQLEAGALVLADRGLCCIDEFGSIRESDKTAIHEAMEQQTISVAKAGLVCKLNTRCSILAATNPKGKYDPNRDIEVNIALASPLLSRFDIIMILLDSQNEDWDKEVSSHILEDEVRQAESRPTSQQQDSTVIHVQEDSNHGLNGKWTLQQMSSYIAFVKTECAPALTDRANKVLTQYYQLQRSVDTRNAARTTIRMLESLVRLAQAHARLMYQQEVTVRDAVVAVMVMESSMRSCGLHGVPSPLHQRFPENPNQMYNEKEEAILTRLGLASLAEPFSEESMAQLRPNPVPNPVTSRFFHRSNLNDTQARDEARSETSSRSATPISMWEPTQASMMTSHSSRFEDLIEPSGEGNANMFLHMSPERMSSFNQNSVPNPSLAVSLQPIHNDENEQILDDVIDFGEDELLDLEAEISMDPDELVDQYIPRQSKFHLPEIQERPIGSQIANPLQSHQLPSQTATPRIPHQHQDHWIPSTARSVTNEEILLDLFGDHENMNPNHISSTPLVSKDPSFSRFHPGFD